MSEIKTVNLTITFTFSGRDMKLIGKALTGNLDKKEELEASELAAKLLAAQIRIHREQATALERAQERISALQEASGLQEVPPPPVEVAEQR